MHTWENKEQIQAFLNGICAKANATGISISFTNSTFWTDSCYATHRKKKNSSFALNFFPLSNGSFRKHFKITQQKKIILKHLETFTSGWGYVFFDTMETHFEKEDSALSWSQVFLFYS